MLALQEFLVCKIVKLKSCNKLLHVQISNIQISELLKTMPLSVVALLSRINSRHFDISASP